MKEEDQAKIVSQGVRSDGQPYRVIVTISESAIMGSADYQGITRKELLKRITTKVTQTIYEELR